jgi:hypothetical protein
MMSETIIRRWAETLAASEVSIIMGKIAMELDKLIITVTMNSQRCSPPMALVLFYKVLTPQSEVFRAR